MDDVTRADNVHLVDTKMFFFDRFNAAYLIRGEETALIDTGVAPSLELVRAGIASHGFSMKDVSYIFVTHEHADHYGNVGPLLRENPHAKVFIHPAGLPFLKDPDGERAKVHSVLPPHMSSRFGTVEPVPLSRIQTLNDGDVVDLGDGEKLRVMFAPGHQPGGTVILAEKHMGLFVNDLVGLNLGDADAAFVFTPPRSHVKQAMESIGKIMDIPVRKLFLGHFGIWDNPKFVFQRALENMQWLLDMGAKCVEEGKPGEIADRFKTRVMPEVEKIRKARGEGIYAYMSDELVPSLSSNFANYYLNMVRMR